MQGRAELAQLRMNDDAAWSSRQKSASRWKPRLTRRAPLMDRAPDAAFQIRGYRGCPLTPQLADMRLAR